MSISVSEIMQLSRFVRLTFLRCAADANDEPYVVVLGLGLGLNVSARQRVVTWRILLTHGSRCWSKVPLSISSPKRY